ncbi:MAG TPA: hypothetical protein VJT54_07235 [Verrucomicrobiae bacterium]|nr:hypothetical protein [Verrucomicrobiae bacterium]
MRLWNVDGAEDVSQESHANKRLANLLSYKIEQDELGLGEKRRKRDKTIDTTTAL